MRGMPRSTLALLLPLALASCAAPRAALAPTPTATATTASDGRAGVVAFNRALIDAMRRMDNTAIVALWEDDGVTLLPGAKPVLGKRAIVTMLEEIARKYPAARMKSFEMECAGIEIEGDVAHEYCDEHQIVELGTGEPPFDGRGKMLFVLHRGADGVWRLRREMWNEGAAAKEQK
jgi:ketosteroid isomerase-like protein